MLRILGLLLLFAAPAAAQPVIAPRLACAELAGADLSALGFAARIEAAAETREGHPAPVCHLRGTIGPTTGFEMWLPLERYSGRYLQIGCGGLCGRISTAAPLVDGCVPYARGEFAMATTDMGHRDPSAASWGQDPERRLDFAFRAVHRTAVVAKAVIARFYGAPPRHSYFSGCSDGGREALQAARRYPADFDGIVAGAPVLDFTVQNTFHHGWTVRRNLGADGRPALLADRLPVLNRLVLAACDARDGEADGVLADPRDCDFDPLAAVCAPGADPAACLTADEARAAAAVYDGARTADGARLTAGGLARGSEANWRGVVAPAASGEAPRAQIFATGVLRNLAFPPAAPDVPTVATLGFDRETFARLAPSQAIFDATGTDLAAFFARGGRLIVWHGWADQDISPHSTLAWWEALGRSQGAARVEQAARLFMIPGLAHCRGGVGATSLDTLTPLLRWVEDGVAPPALTARDAAGAARPVFAFPGLARRDASGGFVRASGRDAAPAPMLGAARFEATPPQWCVGTACAAP